MSSATHPLTLIDPVCGKPAWHAARVPLPTDPVVAEWAEHLDGRPCVDSDPMVCESCGRPIYHGEPWLVEAAIYVPRDGGAPCSSRVSDALALLEVLGFYESLIKSGIPAARRVGLCSKARALIAHDRALLGDGP